MVEATREGEEARRQGEGSNAKDDEWYIDIRKVKVQGKKEMPVGEWWIGGVSKEEKKISMIRFGDPLE